MNAKSGNYQSLRKHLDIIPFDVILQCRGNEQVNVHKVVLIASCEHFARVFSFGGIECSTGIVMIDASYDCVKSLVECMYTNKCEPECFLDFYVLCQMIEYKGVEWSDLIVQKRMYRQLKHVIPLGDPIHVLFENGDHTEEFSNGVLCVDGIKIVDTEKEMGEQWIRTNSIKMRDGHLWVSLASICKRGYTSYRVAYIDLNSEHSADECCFHEEDEVHFEHVCKNNAISFGSKKFYTYSAHCGEITQKEFGLNATKEDVIKRFENDNQ